MVEDGQHMGEPPGTASEDSSTQPARRHRAFSFLIAATTLRLVGGSKFCSRYIFYLQVYDRSNVPIPGRSTGDASRTADLERAMGRMHVGSQGTYGQPSTSSSGPTRTGAPARTGASTDRTATAANRPAGQAFSETTRDPSGNEVRWEVGTTTQYTDPTGAVRRNLNVKSLRAVRPAGKDTRSSSSRNQQESNAAASKIPKNPGVYVKC